MLCAETEFLVCKIFWEINEGEINVENERKKLNEIYNFEPFLIFKFFDVENKNFISNSNFIDFLQTKSIFIDENICNKIINFYDTENKKNLNYSEFLNLILNDEKILLNKINNFPTKNFNLSFEIENCLSKLLEKEILLVKNLEKLLLKLKERKDFSLFDLYLNLKEENDFVSMNKIKEIFFRFNVNFTNEDIKRIFKRIDVNKDGIVSFEDLQKIFDFNNNNNPFTQMKYYDNYNNKNDSSKIVVLSENLRLRESPKKKKSIKKIFSFDFNKKICYSSNEILIQFFNIIIQTEIDIEKLKINLTLQSDFTIENGFKLFNINNRNFITENDFEIGLNKINLFPNNNELKLIIKKYDLKNNGILLFSDVFDMLIPFDKEQRNIIENRKNILLNNNNNIFSESTNFHLKELFIYIIESEKRIEIERKKIGKINTLNFNYFFNEIDSEKKGFFNVQNLTNFFQNFNITFVQKGIDLLFIRLDRKREGKIDFMSFLYEIISRI